MLYLLQTKICYFFIYLLYLLNSNTYTFRFFTFLISTMPQFVHIMIIPQILSCNLINYLQYFFPGFHLKSISVSQSKMIDDWRRVLFKSSVTGPIYWLRNIYIGKCFGTSFLSQSATKYRFRYREKASSNTVSSVSSHIM